MKTDLVESRGDRQSTLAGRVWGKEVTQGQEATSRWATAEKAAAAPSPQVSPRNGHGAGSARSPQRPVRRCWRPEAPQPADARRALANKAPLRICRPAPSPTKRALCPPHPVAAPQPQGTSAAVSASREQSRGPHQPDTTPKRTQPVVYPQQSPQSRKQRLQFESNFMCERSQETQRKAAGQKSCSPSTPSP